MKTLIDINNDTWGKVKYFATIKELSLNKTVDFLLNYALNNQETQKEEMTSI